MELTKLSPVEIQKRLQSILPRVQKPGRYTGGELNQIVKNWEETPTRVALVFPDIYDLGMSNLGLAILYDLINQRHDALAERVFSPWLDMETAMREAGLPLYSLETKHSLLDFDIIGFSLPYETLYTNTLNILDLGNVPKLSRDRAPDDPLVIAGGHATYNPEPMYQFIDAFVIGEGEDVIHEIIETYQEWKGRSRSRNGLLLALAKIWGVYVPSLYEAKYGEGGTFKHLVKLHNEAPVSVTKRIVPKLPTPTTRFIVPYIDTVHNRIPIEIMRGCTRGCRFCHAGIVTRPVRERTVDEITSAIESALRYTGFDEIGLLSLSSSDYTNIVDLVHQVSERYKSNHLSISLPSLRIESVSVDLMNAIQRPRRGGFTLAPEAATEKMRQIINKPVSTAQLLDTAREIYSRGWTTIKLYFMVGHPLENLEDVQAIADLCKAVRAEGRKVIGKKTRVHAGVSTFVPKPHTPFQWVACDTVDQINIKLNLLKRELRTPGIKLTWNNPEETMLEAWLSRGDRRLSDVVFHAWKRGAKFDAWQDQLNFQAWMDAFNWVGLEPAFFTHRHRPLDEVFPWDHINTTVHKKFLVEDYQWSTRAETRVDCRDQCFACGILPTFADLRRQNPGKVWQCPDVKSKRPRSKNEFISLESVIDAS